MLNSATFQDGVHIAHASFKLSKATANQPSEFEIVFADERGVRYEYGFAVDAERTLSSRYLSGTSNLRSQNGTSSWVCRRYRPNVFTEQGVAMLSSVLRSKLAALERKYDAQFKAVFDAIRDHKPDLRMQRRCGW